jgi:hypothetical protein
MGMTGKRRARDRHKTGGQYAISMHNARQRESEGEGRGERRQGKEKAEQGSKRDAGVTQAGSPQEVTIQSLRYRKKASIYLSTSKLLLKS